MLNASLVTMLFLILLFVECTLSVFEKSFRRNSRISAISCHLPYSLRAFKIGYKVVQISGAVEAVLMPSMTIHCFMLGIAATVIGMVLRISAIITLGELWSYHVQLHPNHTVIRTGVYRYFRHPAYIGNIHIPGVLLTIGAPISAGFALIGVTVFYLVRSKAENRLLSRVGE